MTSMETSQPSPDTIRSSLDFEQHSPKSPKSAMRLYDNNNHSRTSSISEDFSEPHSPVTPSVVGSQNRHAKLRLTRSYDPNLTRHRQAEDRSDGHTTKDSLKEKDAQSGSSSSISKLRSVKSFEDAHGPESPDVPSPRTRKKQNYFHKMAVFFHGGPKSPSASSSPFHSEDESHSESEFGFDNSPLASPTVMLKGKSPSSPSSRLLPKKWRFKSSSPKLSPSAASTLWSHEGNCRWISLSGRTVQLTKTLLLYLSEMERSTLQKVALRCLQDFDLGPFAVPKDGSMKRSKKSNFSFKGKNKNSSFLDNLKDNFKDIGKENKDPGNTALVFGIPISKCITNDIALQRRRSSQRKERRESLDLANTTYRIKPAGKGANGKNNTAVNGSGKEVSTRQALPSESSQSESEKSGPNASLLEALSLSTSSSECHRKEKRKALASREPQVPHVVTACFKYIENHGLQVLGIFRVGGSKKRTKQLREEFDSGSDVKFHDIYNAHDVAALLKEYFRDLPEPLLSRELYPAFIATTNIDDMEKRVKVLHCLICLLPIVHVDTLYALLRFLHKVACHAKDSIDENGEELPGNKMDTHNLATLFGPNLLHKLKPIKDKDKDFHCDGSQESVEESREVIEVVQSMIDHYDEIFQVTSEDHNEVMKRLLETDPESLDFILNRISAVQMGYRPSTSESSVFDGSDLSSAPHTPTSDDPFKPKATVEGSTQQSHVNSNYSTHGSPATSPKGQMLTGSAQHSSKSVSFSGGKEREPSTIEKQQSMQTAAMGIKKKKQPPPRLNLSNLPNSPSYGSPVVFYTPPVSPTGPPTYEEHMIRKRVASPVMGRAQSDSNPNKNSNPTSVFSSPPHSSKSVVSPQSVSSLSNYSKSAAVDPWESLYINRTVTSKGNTSANQFRTEVDSGKESVKSPQKTTKESSSRECQREQWLQWQKVAGENSSGDMYEQETLV